MNPLRRALIALGIAGVVLGVPITALNATSDHVDLGGLVGALAALVAFSFLGTGLYLWDRRPDNLTGPLMVALGFSWIAAGLAASNAPGLYVAGSLLGGSPSRSSPTCCSRSRPGGWAARGTAASSRSATWSPSSGR